MTTELDQALSTGDADSIDESLSNMELDGDLLFGGEDEEGELQQTNQTVETPEVSDYPEVIDTTGQAQAKPETDVANGETGKGSDDPSGDAKADLLSDGVREIDGQLYVPVDPKNAHVLGKNGKHTIPYEVLESARNDAGGYKSKLAEMEQELTQVRGSAQRTQLLEKQLEEAGITPDKLPEELLNDPEAIQNIQDEIGGQAGAVIAALISKFAEAKGNNGAAATEQPSEQSQGPQVVDEALNAPENAELNSWSSEDPDRWQMALIIDNKLKNDPSFQSMSVQERFTEVQRRVKTSFGDPVQASIDQELAKQGQEPKQSKQPEQPPAEAQTQVPNSPTSLGGSPSTGSQSAHEALAAQDPMALETSLASMSPEEVEAFLANAAIALD